MLDIKRIRQNPQELRDALKARNKDISIDEFLAQDEKRRTLMAPVEEKKALRNAESKKIGEIKKRGGSAEEVAGIMEEMRKVGDEIAAFDADIAELETYEDRQMFLAEVGLEESGVARLIKSAYKLLNLETYFTAGVQEVRAWTYEKGWKAPQCAGVIHTDFEKGFIRAEVIKYDDYIRYGSEAAVKEAGKLGVEGKEYVVQDGDIMHFRFNV